MQPGAARDAEVRPEPQAAPAARVLSSITTSDSPGEPGQQLLELADRRSPAAPVASSRSRSALGAAHGLAACSCASRDLLGGGLEALDLLGDDAGLVAVLVVDAAADQSRSSRPRARASQAAERLAEHEHLDRGLEVVERGEHHRVALLGPDPLGLR